MLQTVLTWFYCLAIKDAVLLVIVVSMVYLVLRHCLGKKHFWRTMVTLLFLVWIIGIVAATLTDRTPGTIPAEPQLLPFHSYRAVLEGENKEILPRVVK